MTTFRGPSSFRVMYGKNGTSDISLSVYTSNRYNELRDLFADKSSDAHEGKRNKLFQNRIEVDSDDDSTVLVKSMGLTARDYKADATKEDSTSKTGSLSLDPEAEGIRSPRTEKLEKRAKKLLHDLMDGMSESIHDVDEPPNNPLEKDSAQSSSETEIDEILKAQVLIEDDEKQLLMKATEMIKRLQFENKSLRNELTKRISSDRDIITLLVDLVKFLPYQKLASSVSEEAAFLDAERVPLSKSKAFSTVPNELEEEISAMELQAEQQHGLDTATGYHYQAKRNQREPDDAMDSLMSDDGHGYVVPTINPFLARDQKILPLWARETASSMKKKARGFKPPNVTSFNAFGNRVVAGTAPMISPPSHRGADLSAKIPIRSVKSEPAKRSSTSVSQHTFGIPGNQRNFGSSVYNNYHMDAKGPTEWFNVNAKTPVTKSAVATMSLNDIRLREHNPLAPRQRGGAGSSPRTVGSSALDRHTTHTTRNAHPEDAGMRMNKNHVHATFGTADISPLHPMWEKSSVGSAIYLDWTNGRDPGHERLYQEQQQLHKQYYHQQQHSQQYPSGSPGWDWTPSASTTLRGSPSSVVGKEEEAQVLQTTYANIQKKYFSATDKNF